MPSGECGTALDLTAVLTECAVAALGAKLAPAAAGTASALASATTAVPTIMRRRLLGIEFLLHSRGMTPQSLLISGQSTVCLHASIFCHDRPQCSFTVLAAASRQFA